MSTRGNRTELEATLHKLVAWGIIDPIDPRDVPLTELTALAWEWGWFVNASDEELRTLYRLAKDGDVRAFHRALMTARLVRE